MLSTKLVRLRGKEARGSFPSLCILFLFSLVSLRQFRWTEKKLIPHLSYFLSFFFVVGVSLPFTSSSSWSLSSSLFFFPVSSRHPSSSPSLFLCNSLIDSDIAREGKDHWYRLNSPLAESALTLFSSQSKILRVSFVVWMDRTQMNPVGDTYILSFPFKREEEFVQKPPSCLCIKSRLSRKQTEQKGADIKQNFSHSVFSWSLFSFLSLLFSFHFFSCGLSLELDPEAFSCLFSSQSTFLSNRQIVLFSFLLFMQCKHTRKIQ